MTLARRRQALQAMIAAVLPPSPVEAQACFLARRLAALLSEVSRYGGRGAYTALYPDGYGVLWLGAHPSPTLLDDVGRLLPGGRRLVRLTGQVGWRFQVDARDDAAQDA